MLAHALTYHILPSLPPHLLKAYCRQRISYAIRQNDCTGRDKSTPGGKTTCFDDLDLPEPADHAVVSQ